LIDDTIAGRESESSTLADGGFLSQRFKACDIRPVAGIADREHCIIAGWNLRMRPRIFRASATVPVRIQTAPPAGMASRASSTRCRIKSSISRRRAFAHPASGVSDAGGCFRAADNAALVSFHLRYRETPATPCSQTHGRQSAIIDSEISERESSCSVSDQGDAGRRPFCRITKRLNRDSASPILAKP
jgi:hypothetical protein